MNAAMLDTMSLSHAVREASVVAGASQELGGTELSEAAVAEQQALFDEKKAIEEGKQAIMDKLHEAFWETTGIEQWVVGDLDVAPRSNVVRDSPDHHAADKQPVISAGDMAWHGDVWTGRVIPSRPQ